MSDLFEILKFFVGFSETEISVIHVTMAAVSTALVYVVIFLAKRFIRKLDVNFSFLEFCIKFGIAFVVEFLLIWIYSPKVWFLAVVLGLLVALYCRNRLFAFLDTEAKADSDLSMRLELAELRNKFKKNPHYSILEILLYYGYISAIQKETVETKNIFKTPDEMAIDMLGMPLLTEEQLREAKGIMNVIRREGKILTREEAILHIMRMVGDKDVSIKKMENGSSTDSSGDH